MGYTPRTVRHPIQVVARRTGLSPDLIRAWERRYCAVAPKRSETGRRLYTDADVERLLLLRRVTEGGRRISDVARLPLEELTALAEADVAATTRAVGRPGRTSRPTGEHAHLDACIDAVRRMDGADLDAALARAARELGTTRLLEGVLAPMMRAIGDGWERGDLGPRHEHVASSVVRSLLGLIPSSRGAVIPGPALVVATPAGQRHELGALMVAITAGNEGWRVTYLGPDLPAEEIAAAARQSGARAVALSLVQSGDDATEEEIGRLRRLLPADVALVVGGSGAKARKSFFDAIGGAYLEDLDSLRAHLDRLAS